MQNGNYTVQFTDSNGCSATSLPFNVSTVGINNRIVNNNAITIFPNPSNGIFKVEVGNLQPTKVKIYDITGEIIYQSEIRNSEIDLSAKPKGFYFLQMRSGEKIFNKKLIIQ